MKKKSTIIEEKNTYDIGILINNTAYINSVTGKSGLLNVKTNQIIGNMDNFYRTTYDTDQKFYFQMESLCSIFLGQQSLKFE